MSVHAFNRSLGAPMALVHVDAHADVNVQAEQCWYRSLEGLMNEVRTRCGSTRSIYRNFDIDGLDRSVAPGTGMPQVGGLMTAQNLEVIRGAFGANLAGSNFLFEMLCSFLKCRRRTAVLKLSIVAITCEGFTNECIR